MTLRLLRGDVRLAFNDVTLQHHVTSVAGDGTITDLGAINSGEAASHVAQDAKTSAAGWDADSDELLLTATSRFVYVGVTEDTWVVINSLTANPTTDGLLLPGGQVYRLATSGQTKLHYKQDSAAGSVSIL